jgi:hypothetical protein
VQGPLPVVVDRGVAAAAGLDAVGRARRDVRRRREGAVAASAEGAQGAVTVLAVVARPDPLLQLADRVRGLRGPRSERVEGQLEGAGPLELVAHPQQMLAEGVRLQGVAGAALDLEQMRVDAAHEGDQAVVVVDDPRAGRRRAARAGRQRRQGEDRGSEELPHGSFLSVSP